MFVIGITGGIGSGKSTVADICREYGLPVISADEISHIVTSSNGSAIEEIIEEFGMHVIDESMALDRTKMANIVFKDKTSLDKLSKIVHRHVIEQIQSEVDRYNKEKAKAVVLDVPIPVKKGFLDITDQVWTVWTDNSLRILRLAERGMTEAEVKRRISFQMDKEEYEKIADIIITNNGTKKELRDTVIENLDEQLHMRGIKI